MVACSCCLLVNEQPHGDGVLTRFSFSFYPILPLHFPLLFSPSQRFRIVINYHKISSPIERFLFEGKRKKEKKKESSFQSRYADSFFFLFFSSRVKYKFLKSDEWRNGDKIMGEEEEEEKYLEADRDDSRSTVVRPQTSALRKRGAARFSRIPRFLIFIPFSRGIRYQSR